MFTSFSCPETSEHLVFFFFLAQGGRLNDLRLIVYYQLCIIGLNFEYLGLFPKGVVEIILYIFNIVY